MSSNAEMSVPEGPGEADPVRVQEVRFQAADGYKLAGTLYESARSNGLTVQINSASATARSFYRHFASYLARRGFSVLCYDFRGIGDSGGGRPFGEDASPLAWGGLDTPAASAFLKDRYPERALTIVAHSLGGQVLGLSGSIGEVRAIHLLACAHGYWRRWPDRRTRWKLALLWHLNGPLALALLGRVPGWVTGTRDTPRQIAIETGRFVRSPHFFCTEEGGPLRPHNADIRCPLRHYVFADDEVFGPGGDIDLEDYFPNALRERLVLSPRDLHLDKLGHFGFFRRAANTGHWDGVADWLLATATRP